MTRPAKSDVYRMDVAPLEALAAELDGIIETMLSASHDVHHTVYRFDWEGVANDAALRRADRQVDEDHVTLTAMGDLRDANRDGAAAMGPMIEVLRRDGQGMEADDFIVAENWEVTDGYHYEAAFRLASLYSEEVVSALKAMQAQRAGEAATATARLQSLADEFGEADARTGAAIDKANNALNASVGSSPTTTPAATHKDGPVIQLVDNEVPADGTDEGQAPGEGEPEALPPPNPTINGSGTSLTAEEQNTGVQDDLDASIPNTGIALGGDPKLGDKGGPNILIPGSHKGPNPLSPGTGPQGQQQRPLPTGTAVGPNGERYGFYGIVPYTNADGSPNTTYSVPDTVVVDLSNPSKVLYTLHGISQASGAYDSASGRMIIMGNDASGNRSLWQSDPISTNPKWGDSLTSQGTFTGAMNGNRESQIVSLPQGGFLAVGASQTMSGAALPVEAVAASTPSGLLTASAVEVAPSTFNGQGVYGPTITGITSTDGQESITMRISTYGPADGTYDPGTASTTFTITPGQGTR